MLISIKLFCSCDVMWTTLTFAFIDAKNTLQDKRNVIALEILSWHLLNVPLLAGYSEQYKQW